MNTVVTIAQCVADQGTNEVVIQIPAGQSVEVIDEAAAGMAVTIVLRVGRDAAVTYKASFAVSEGVVERSVTAESSEPGSAVSLLISCHTTQAGQFTLHTVQSHQASHTASSARIVGVSEQNSRVSVTSTIYIAPSLAAVTARQVHKQLLLDAGSRAVSVPALDILSDDVSCSHGSAITYLDPAQLFYLSARGYRPDEARTALVKAFLQ